MERHCPRALDAAALPSFLSSHLALLVGTGLLALLWLAMALSRDLAFRRDVRGALLLLATFLPLRLAHLGLRAQLPPSMERLLRVAWMLALAFGAIRGLVSSALWLVRRFWPSPPPKILRDVLDFTLYAVAAVSILRSQLHIDLTGLLATSAILSVVLGLAVQDSLGNLFAGLSLQLERPFQVGDFVSLGPEHVGRVVQLTWRATRIETLRNELVTLPNNVVAKQAIVNLSRPQSPGTSVAVDFYVGGPYRVPPNRVRDAILDCLEGMPKLVAIPPPRVRVWSYDDSSIRYQVRLWVADYAHADLIRDELYTRLWYRFDREGIEIPFPQRTVHLVPQSEANLPSSTRDELVARVDLFSPLTSSERARVAADFVERRFGRGERIITEGAAGHTFYLVARGTVAVRSGKNDASVAELGPGEYFGEMSLLTGEPRTATVVAQADVVLLELDRPSFARMFAEHPGLASQLSSLLARRKSELEAAVSHLETAVDTSPEANRILGRLKQIFGLRSD